MFKIEGLRLLVSKRVKGKRGVKIISERVVSGYSVTKHKH
jgi:hypothetical protein